MDKRTLNSVLRTKELTNLQLRGLRVTSTARQLTNGTIVLTNRFGRTYKVTATGAVLSNEFVARRVLAETEVGLYREGFKAVDELITRRA